MTNIDWDKLLSEIMASLTHLRESGALADLNSHDQVRLFKRLTALQAEIEYLVNQIVGPDKAVVRVLPPSAITRDRA